MIGELNKSQIETLLISNTLARLACYAHEELYIIPVSYAYRTGSILGYSNKGKKIDMMRANPKVCLEIDEFVNRSNWQSAVVWGVFEELNGDEAEEAQSVYSSRFHPLIQSETAIPKYSMEKMHKQSAMRTSDAIIYRIRITKMTGRFERN